MNVGARVTGWRGIELGWEVHRSVLDRVERLARSHGVALKPFAWPRLQPVNFVEVDVEGSKEQVDGFLREFDRFWPPAKVTQ